LGSAEAEPFQSGRLKRLKSRCSKSRRSRADGEAHRQTRLGIRAKAVAHRTRLAANVRWSQQGPSADWKHQELRMSEQNGDVKALLEHVTRALVDVPDQVSVNHVEEDGETVLELTVAESDLGKVIGKSGRTARALRTLLSAAGVKSGKRYALEILE